jgi:hypothetical protein
LDLGGNALHHGDWCASRDWKDIFENPDKPSDGKGIAPIKLCTGCEAILPASATICKYCGADNSKGILIDDAAAEFELLTESRPLSLKVEDAISGAEGRRAHTTLFTR